MSDPEELITLIHAAVSDGGRAARESIVAEARAGDELELIFWCYAALIRWGQDGLDLIVDTALRGPKVKHKSAALTLLTGLAVYGSIRGGQIPFIPESLLTSLNQHVYRDGIKAAAKHALRLLILSMPTEELLIPVSQSMIHLQLTDGEIAEELVSALGIKWLRFGLPLLDAFEQMLTDKAADEPSFQSFFCEYPQLLDPMAVHVWSQPDFHGALEPDFLIRRADDSYLVVEIECPAKLLVTGDGLVSQHASHAEAQALEYADFLSARIAEARTHFPNYRNADCLAIVGLERILSNDQVEALERANSRKHNSRIVGFDWLEFDIVKLTHTRSF